jgi:hypothetical protein
VDVESRRQRIGRLRAIRGILVALGTFCAVVVALNIFWWRNDPVTMWIAASGAGIYAGLVADATRTIRRRKRAA